MNTLDLFKAIIAYIKGHTIVSVYTITMTAFLAVNMLSVGKLSMLSTSFQLGYIALLQIFFGFGLFCVLALDHKKGLADKENQNDFRELEEDLE
ncbi:hypothetical protein ACSTLD_14445 [Vibrio parahaemolyticus]